MSSCAFVVADLAERDIAAQMFVAVGVAAGAAERALARDLDRQRGTVSAEDPPPRRDNSFHPSTISSIIGGRVASRSPFTRCPTVRAGAAAAADRAVRPIAG